jgi:GTPase SAR1 family protein
MSSFRSLRQESGDGQQKISKSVFETIVVGDAYCGKTTYLSRIIEKQRESNSPIRVSDDKNEFEFVVQSNTKRTVFKVKDTASNSSALMKTQ